MFIIYINDLVVLQDEKTKVSIYADDNNFKLKLSGDQNQNKIRIEEKMKEIQDYMDSNRLKLNPDKTKLMILTTKSKNMHKNMKINFGGSEIEQVEFTKFLGIIISANLKWNEYIVQNEQSMLKFLNKRLAALKMLSREMPVCQRKILAHGLLISKISYCISCYANCPGYLKKRLQDIVSQAARVVQGDWSSKLKQVFVDLNWLSFEGWQNYLDVLTGKTMADFQKPLDLASKIYQNIRATAGDQLWNEENQRITRAMVAGKIMIGGHNMGTTTARHQSFTARYVRQINLLPTETRCTNLSTAKFIDKEKFKCDTRSYFMLHQKYL